MDIFHGVFLCSISVLLTTLSEVSPYPMQFPSPDFPPFDCSFLPEAYPRIQPQDEEEDYNDAPDLDPVVENEVIGHEVKGQEEDDQVIMIDVMPAGDYLALAKMGFWNMVEKIRSIDLKMSKLFGFTDLNNDIEGPLDDYY